MNTNVIDVSINKKTDQLSGKNNFEYLRNIIRNMYNNISSNDVVMEEYTSFNGINKPPVNPVTDIPNLNNNFRDPYKSHNTEDIVIEKKDKNSFTRPKKINYASNCKNINKYIPGLKVRELLNNPNNCQFINKHINHSHIYGPF